MLWVVVLLCSGVVGGVEGGRKPPLGWNSWNFFHASVSAELLLETAQAMKTTGLHDAGYVYINTDDGWVNQGRDGGGKLVPGANFGGNWSAVGELASKIAGLGLQFGIYEAEGETTCLGRSGSLYHEDVDARSFAAAGVKYLKQDNCGEVNLNSFSKFSAMRDAMGRAGMEGVFYSSEPHLQVPISWPVEVATGFRSGGGSWRTGGDISGSFARMMEELVIVNAWAEVTGPSAFGDADMLEVGSSGMTLAEQRTHFALWAMVRSPLLIGVDLRSMSNETFAILSNKALLSVSQNDVVKQAALVESFPGTTSLQLPRAVETYYLHAAALSTRFHHPTSTKHPITACSYSSVPSAQQWNAVWESDGKVQLRQGSNCLQSASGSVVVGACGEASWWGMRGGRNVSLTPAQLVATSGDCAAFNGTSFLLRACASEPGKCATERCATSALVNQLFYHSQNTLQLSSTFTNTTVPPLHSHTKALKEVQDRFGLSILPEYGTKVEMLACNDSDPAQTWTHLPSKQLQSKVDDMCLDGDSVATCTSIPTQTWTFHPPPSLQLTTQTGQCMDVYNFSGPNVQLYDCKTPTNTTRGSQNEEFVFTPSGMIQSQVSQSCCGTPSRPIPNPLCLSRVPRSPPALINIPFCVATEPNPSPPTPPPLPPSANPSNALQVWAGPLANGEFVVALLNAQNDGKNATITANFTIAGIPTTTSFTATDAYSGEVEHGVKGGVSRTVAAHDVAALLLTPE